MSLAPCVWLPAATERRAVPPGSAEGRITHQANQLLTLVLQQLMAAGIQHFPKCLEQLSLLIQPCLVLWL